MKSYQLIIIDNKSKGKTKMQPIRITMINGIIFESGKNNVEFIAVCKGSDKPIAEVHFVDGSIKALYGNIESIDYKD